MGIRTDLEDNFDFDIVDEFLDHFSMMSESMEIMILDLSKPDMYNRSVEELFRVFHNIKSATGFLKITSMTKLSSLVEDELEILRSRDTLPNEDIVTWLLNISDMYLAWNKDFQDDRELSRVKFSLLKIPDTMDI